MEEVRDAGSPANLALIVLAAVFFAGLIVFTLAFYRAGLAGMCGFFTGQFTARANWRFR